MYAEENERVHGDAGIDGWLRPSCGTPVLLINEHMALVHQVRMANFSTISDAAQPIGDAQRARGARLAGGHVVLARAAA